MYLFTQCRQSVNIFIVSANSMLKKANLTDIFISFNIVSWLLLLVVNVFTLLDKENTLVFGSSAYLRGLILNLFLLFAFFYYQYRIFSDEL
ncbi:MAG: hypothetical protein H7Y04_01705, partial [Verrucomicrobia bacterium]|nr:hypothetical protein [Cytophagales bacterium]